MIYLVFAILLPSMCFLDYRDFQKRLEKDLQKQPDYETNEANYMALYERLCTRQKSMEITVGIVLAALALVLFVYSRSIGS